MSIFNSTFIKKNLSKPTSIFGLPLWIVIVFVFGSIIVIILFFLSLCFTYRRRRRRNSRPSRGKAAAVKEIHQVATCVPAPVQKVQVEHGLDFRDKLRLQPPLSSGRQSVVSLSETRSCGSGSVGPEVSHIGWGRWYTLRELEEATNGLCDENVIGLGGHGIVYRGVLSDGTKVAVKNLLNKGGKEAEQEFKVEVEAIGRVQHKNLVRLLGYCVEGTYRMLVYEYIENGNLEQWLHGDVGGVSPLTWDIRMNIILGAAKGLAYLHEGLEPKIVHRDIKSSNILLDHRWNSKLSDFGLVKLLGTENSHVTTRVMGTFGYVAPEYLCTGMLTEKSDIYSFGILMMEIISGRYPVDNSRPKVEVNLLEWLKTMIGNRKSGEVADPNLPEMPASKALKRVLLVALRCVDPDASKRPKIGHVIHMLEANDLIFRDSQERRIAKVPSHSHHGYRQENHAVASLGNNQLGEGTSESSDGDSSKQYHQPTWRR